ncbi:MAG: hypothetical protein SOZ07_01785 [Prevotella sp.]|nr:hypothetical protein [Prevotella sp.]MDD7273818.1 hypothetical protein [Prevotellaceae bacterium]MDY3935376.1 hypothetical protein [Prevotella sp.]MDY4218770.1 hypothetical protein [Prevotella sp.]
MNRKQYVAPKAEVVLLNLQGSIADTDLKINSKEGEETLGKEVGLGATTESGYNATKWDD